jgi:hypothetical protein
VDRHVEKRWSTLKCYGSNYKHTASWGYLAGIYQRIDNACNAMIGNGEYKWLEKGQSASFHTTMSVAPGSKATHATVSFMANKGGTHLHKTQCREALRHIQDGCATGNADSRFTYGIILPVHNQRNMILNCKGGSVWTDDGNILAVIAFFPDCCFFGWDYENDSLPDPSPQD